MGDKIFETSVYVGYQTRTSRNSVNEDARREVLPLASSNTIRSWLDHYMLHGETLARTMAFEQELRRKYPQYTTRTG
jgi:hypothetical protein